jgi:hypothetical protein
MADSMPLPPYVLLPRRFMGITEEAEEEEAKNL